MRRSSGFGKVFGTFGARTADSAPTLPLPLRSRKRANERAPASERISEREPIPVAAPRRHEGAHVARLDRGKRFQRRLLAGVLGEKAEELAHVALIGLDGLRRHAPLGAKMRKPAPQLRRDVGGGELQRVVVLQRHQFSRSPHPEERVSASRRARRRLAILRDAAARSSG